MARQIVRVCCLAFLLTTLTAQPSAAGTITFIGLIRDQTDFSDSGMDIGNVGYWFPQFNSSAEVTARPTNENQRDALPSWAGPLNHTTNAADPTRTFSQDNGGVRSEGGDPAWNTFTLPDGESGLSGSLVDPQTKNNSNNTFNRILLGSDTPSTFYLSIVVDNTNFEHDPINRVRARGNDSGTDIEANTYPTTSSLFFNSRADAYVFRYDGFSTGDYIKVQLNGAAAPKTGGGLAGLMFDTINPLPVPEPASVIPLAAGGIGLIMARIRRGRQ